MNISPGNHDGVRHYGGHDDRPLWSALLQGFRQRCPRCGRGGLFRRYLKVVDTCPACGEAMHHQRADDAPPYFTILIVGHLIVPAALLLEQTAQPPMVAAHARLRRRAGRGLSFLVADV